MTSMRQEFTFMVLALVCFLLIFTGCGKPSLETIEIDPSTATVTVGETLQLQASGRDAKGNAIADLTFTWSVDGDSGSVDAQGLFTALKPGQVSVTAAAESKQASASITVQRQAVARIVATAEAAEVVAGERTQVTLSVQNASEQGLAEVEVQAQSSAEGTKVEPASATTNAAGQVTFTVTAATKVGANPVQFRADQQQTTLVVQGIAGAPAHMVVAAAAPEVVAGEETAVHVTVQDRNQNPTSGVPVRFEPIGEQVSVSPEQATTDAQGGASTRVRVSPKVGLNQLRVSAADLEAQVVEIKTLPGNPAKITLQADSPETIASGAVTLTVQVQDAYDNPLASIPIQMSVSPADARFNATTLTTNDRGIAYVSLKTSATPGDNDVQATVEALPSAELTVVGQAPEALQVLPQSATVDMQGSHRFRALASDASGHTVEVIPAWKVVGDRGTVDTRGVFTATALGSDVLLATYAELTAGAQVTVVTGPVADLNASPSEATIVSGTNQQFQVTAFNAYGYPLDVTPVWQVVGGVGSIDAAGLFTATKAGSGEIVVTAEQVSARIPVTVSPGELTAIEISPPNAELQAGEELQVETTGRDAAGNAVEIDPTWHLTADIGELDASGHFRAIHAGKGRVRVQAGMHPVTAEIPVRVRPAALARLEVHPPTSSLSAGEALQFTVSGYDGFDNPIEVVPQWQLTATVGSIDTEGMLAARKSGSAKVQAMVGEIVGEASVVVKPGPLATLAIEPDGPLELAAGDTIAFNALGHDAYGNTVTLTPEWTQSEPLGTLNSDGQFRAETVGNTEIRMQSEAQTAVVSVTITPGKLARITVSPADVTVAAGDTVSFTASGYDAYDNEVDIQASWRLVNNLGDIDATGKFRAMQAQTGEVIATAAGISGRAQVMVTAGPLTHLEVTPHELELMAGEKAQITVVGYDAFGNPMPTQPVWQVTEGMGTITPEGLLTAQKAGEGRVVAAVHHLAIIVDLKVMRGDLARLQIEPPTARVASGSQVSFAVQGFDLGGNPVEVEPTWEVGGDIGSIAADGSFTGGRAGTGTVAVTVGALQAEAEVTVEPGEVASLRVTPESANLIAGESLQLQSEAFDAAGNRVSTLPMWRVEPNLGSVSSAGVFRAMHAGSGTLVATIGEIQQSVQIEVQAGQLASIHLLPAKSVILAGGKEQFTAEGYDAYGNAVPITPRWSLEGMIGQIDPEQGTFQAITAGSGTIVAVVDTIAGLAAVTVEPARVARLRLQPEKVVVTAGEDVQVRLSAYDAHDNVTMVEPTWELSAPLGQLADGVFRAQHVGTTEIIATSGDLSARTNVEIQPGAVVRLQVTPQEAQVTAGENYTFRAVGFDAFDNESVMEGVVWRLQGDIGHLDANGVFTGGKQGRGQILVQLGDLSSQAEVVVVPGPVKRLVIKPAYAQVAAMSAQPFTAQGLDAGGNQLPVTVHWAGSGDIGSVQPSGNFSANRVGSGEVVAYTDSLMQTAKVAITPGPVALLFVTPQQATIPAGETVQFQVQGFDALHNPIPNLRPQWSVLGGIGRVDPDTGVFMAQQKGWGKVQAAVAKVQGSADVRVGHGEPDAGQSRMVASRVAIVADGQTTADIIVLVRDPYGNPVPEAQVTLISSRDDRIEQPLPSNRQGVAVGRIRSNTPGQSEINAVVATGRVSNTLRLTFLPASASG